MGTLLLKYEKVCFFLELKQVYKTSLEFCKNLCCPSILIRWSRWIFVQMRRTLILTQKKLKYVFSLYRKNSLKIIYEEPRYDTKCNKVHGSEAIFSIQLDSPRRPVNFVYSVFGLNFFLSLYFNPMRSTYVINVIRNTIK